MPFTVDLEALLKEQQTIHDALKKQNRIVPLVFHRDGERIRDPRGLGRPLALMPAALVASRTTSAARRVRNLECAGVPRSAAMAMVGHKTESIYRRYAIVDAGVLREAAAKIDEARTAAGTISGTTTNPSSRPAPQTA